MACCQPVAHVAFWQQTGQRHHFEAGGHAVQTGGDGVAVGRPRRVVIGQDDHMGTSERGAVVALPLARPAHVRGGGQAVQGELVGVFLPFHDVDQLASGDGGQHLGQAVEHPRHAGH